MNIFDNKERNVIVCPYCGRTDRWDNPFDFCDEDQEKLDIVCVYCKKEFEAVKNLTITFSTFEKEVK